MQVSIRGQAIPKSERGLSIGTPVNQDGVVFDRLYTSVEFKTLPFTSTPPATKITSSKAHDRSVVCPGRI